MSPRKLHRQPRPIRRQVAALLVGQYVCVDIEHLRDGASVKWCGELLAVAEPLSHGVSDALILRTDERTVSISLATVAKISPRTKPAAK